MPILQLAQRAFGHFSDRRLWVVEGLPDPVGVLDLAGDAEHPRRSNPDARGVVVDEHQARVCGCSDFQRAATLAHISRTRQAGFSSAATISTAHASLHT